MSTTTNTELPAVLAPLAGMRVADIRRAFAAHQALTRTQLVRTPDGIGHVRDTGHGDVLVCGRAPDPGESWHYGADGGVAILPRLGCAACAEHLVELRDRAADETETLRLALAHTRAVTSVLGELQNAAKA